MRFMFEDIETETHWICGFCSKEYHKGQVFPIGEEFYNAEWAFKLHKDEHDIVEEILKLIMKVQVTQVFLQTPLNQF